MMPNTCFEDGAYFDLFLTSDALIHDCSTFMAEYLITEKPVMFVMRDDNQLNLNEYAQRCFEQHYLGHSINDVERFINEVVLGGNDTRQNERQSFVRNYLLPKGDVSVAENIFNEMCNELL